MEVLGVRDVDLQAVTVELDLSSSDSLQVPPR